MNINKLILNGIFTVPVLFFCQPGPCAEEKLEKAVFAGGCFWCMITPFQQIPGVKEVVAGYTGGDEKDPNYEKVASGLTGHLEAVQITFDPAKVKYQRLLEVFWQQIDPTDEGGQFVDRGRQYGTAIFYLNEDQRKAAEISREELVKSNTFDKPVVTRILKAKTFYKAERYHQDYPKKNPHMYDFYRENSGRDQFLQKTWKKKK